MSALPHPTALIAPDATVEPDVAISAFVQISSRAAVRSGAKLGTSAFLDEETFVGAGAQIGPGAHLGRGAKVGDGARVSANATIAAGILIGTGAVVEAGAVVMRSVPPNAIVVGNPAQISGYVSTAPVVPTVSTPGSRVRATRVPGVKIYELPQFKDLRGDLVVTDFSGDLPFVPKRHFLVHNVTSGEIRGEHAHRECHQFLYAIAGSCRVVADDGREREEFILDRPSLGLYLPPMIWATQYRYSADGVLGVFASHAYSAEDYIRDYAEFRVAAAGAR